MPESARRSFVGGNWKCNGSVAEISTLVKMLNEGKHYDTVDVVVAPAAIHLYQVKEALKVPVEVASQNCYFQSSGAWTGELSTEMLVDMGLKNVVLGHSERRHVLGETDELIAKKTKKAIDAGLTVIFCIGEQLDERKAGRTNEVCFGQLDAIKAVLTEEEWAKIVIAYEPVYAIGTGVAASPEDAQATHEDIRAYLAKEVSQKVADATRILYGGSVKAANAAALFAKGDIDGFLVGGASLKPEFMDIIKACAN